MGYPTPRSRALLVSALLLGALAAQSPELDSKVADVESRLLQARVQLAARALDSGLLREGSILAQQVLESQPEHELVRRLESIKALSGES